MSQDNMFSERLQAKRNEKGLSQNALAKKIGLSRSLYNKYERAGIRPSHETLILLAKELNTSVDYLIGNTDIATDENKKSAAITDMTEALNVFLREKLGSEPTKEDIALADKIFDTFA